MNKSQLSNWGFRIILAALYLMMSMPKFAGDEMTIHIFTTLGVEPWGRMATGVIELAIAVLLLIPFTAIYGVLLSAGTIFGALLSHVFVLGLVVKNESGTINDGGEIFITALIILALTLVNLFIHRHALPRPKKVQLGTA